MDVPTHTFYSDGHGYCVHCELPKGNRRHRVASAARPIRPPSAPEPVHSKHRPALPSTGTLKAHLLDVVAMRSEGATDDELETLTGRTHQSVSAARRGLVIDGHLVPRLDTIGNEVTRRTRSGHAATVWVPARLALVQADAS